MSVIGYFQARAYFTRLKARLTTLTCNGMTYHLFVRIKLRTVRMTDTLFKYICSGDKITFMSIPLYSPCK